VNLRLLANENLPRAAIESLRRRGHDVIWAREVMRGASDPEVLDRAVRERRLLITFDKDFGELAFGRGLPAECGIILLRFPQTSPHAVAAAVVEALDEEREWVGHFTVMEPFRIRTVPLGGESQ